MLDFLKTDPIAFEIPIGDGFAIYWYGIIIIIGIGLAAWWASREIERRGQSVDELFNGLIAVVFSGYFFARLTYVALDVIDGNGARYETLLDVINVRAGGVNILGGFVGAALVGLLFARWRHLKAWHYADVAGPALLLAQAIGRWGNFINQELYGPPTTLPWGITIDAPYRLPEYNNLTEFPLETRFHPTFLYESLLLLIGFFVLTYLNNRFRETWKPGTLFGAFMVWWGAGRVFIEFFRPDQPAIGASFVTYSMLAAALVAIAGVVVILNRAGRLPGLGPSASSRRKRRIAKPKPVRDNK
ncbi:MAG: prolipoprotein diacylglyceryl transferase [Ardenticatenaceae bacterium]|nr:prolipoprotein diacylglyceryl transferase [Ardenticatenaceae bacterium]